MSRSTKLLIGTWLNSVSTTEPITIPTQGTGQELQLQRFGEPRARWLVESASRAHFPTTVGGECCRRGARVHRCALPVFRIAIGNRKNDAWSGAGSASLGSQRTATASAPRPRRRPPGVRSGLAVAAFPPWGASTRSENRRLNNLAPLIWRLLWCAGDAPIAGRGEPGGRA
jgi:hypothetical protein